MHRTLLAVFVCALAAHPARAAIVIPAGQATPLVSGPGDGLFGQFWDATGALVTTTDALNVIGANPATATFLATLIDYPDGATTSIDDNTLLPAFLGPNAQNLVGGATSNLAQSVFLFTGFLRIANPGTFRFAVGSDDGFRLTIGGELAGEFAGERGFGYTTTDELVFSQAGLYPISLLYFENGGITGIEFRSGSNTGPLVSSDLFTTPIPEPASLGVIGGALLFLAMWNRRKAS